MPIRLYHESGQHTAAGQSLDNEVRDLLLSVMERLAGRNFCTRDAENIMMIAVCMVGAEVRSGQKRNA